MRLLLSLLLTACASAELLDGIFNLDAAFEPMVAFACGRPSLFMTDQGWKADRTQNCLTKSDEIMSYCKLKYPASNITNFIPAASETTVDWESLTGSITEKITVRPYRCIAGEFNSDALLVPDMCQFGHIENDVKTTPCQSYDQWNATVHQHCADGRSTLYSFSVIVPCSFGMFSGAEFVCCPAKTTTEGTETNPQPLVDTAASNVSIPKQDTEYYYQDDAAGKSEPEYQYNDETLLDDKQDTDFNTYNPSTNYYVLYMETPEKLGRNEHEAYSMAILFSKRYYMDEQKRLDQQLDELNTRYKALTAKNVTMAKSLYSQQEKTLKDLFKKVKETWESIRSSINEEHERRIVASLENRRLDGIENFMNALGDAAEYDDLEAVKPLMQALKKYIRSEEKERIHWINRYEHMLDTNPDEAERIKMTVKEMLLQIQQRIASVTQSLKRVPRIRATVRSLLKEFLNDFDDVDQEVRFLFPDLDMAADVEKLMPPLEQVTTPYADDLIATGIESDYLWVTPNWFEKNNLVGMVSNRTILIIIGTSVTSAVLLTIVLMICCARRCRNSTDGRVSGRKSHMRHRPSHIYHVPAGPIVVCKDTFSGLPNGVVHSPATDDANLRKMQMRGYVNPINGGSLRLQDSETATLVDNDANELQKQFEQA